ncbi:MAG: hypothetical protein WCP57_08335 [Bacteroidota bacterium]
MIKRIYSIFFLLLICTTILFSQNKSIGTWQLYLPLNTSNSIAQSNNYIYSSTGQSIIKYEKSTHAIEILDKTNGLSELSINKIAYDPSTSSLVVLYTSSAIDIINENNNTIYTINDIKNKTISGDKSLRNIFFDEGLAYISTGFSIQVIDLTKKEFKEAYYIGNTGGNVVCNDICIYNGKIYVATKEGLKFISKNNPGILNYNNWQNIHSTGVIPNQIPDFIEVFDNNLYLIQNDSLYSFNGSTWSNLGSNKYWETKDLSVANDELVLTQWKDSASIILSNRILKLSKTLNFTSIISNDLYRPTQCISGASNQYYIADNWRGLIYFDNIQFEIISANSPKYNSAFALTIDDSKVYVAGGSYNGSFNYTFNASGFSLYKDKWWNNFDLTNTPILSNVYDIISITPDSKSDKVYYSSLLNGLIISDAGEFKLYNSSNSILEQALGDPRTRVSDVKIDLDGNVIILNNSAPNPIKAIDKKGDWYTINGTPGVLGLKRMIIDQNNQMWISVKGSVSMMVVDKGDITTTTDDKSITLGTSIGSGALPNETVFAMAEDLDGDIWVGTGAGIGVFYCASSILNEGNYCDAQKILVQRDGYNEYLFEKQAVKALAVDGANRKWIGTANGVWLISADGKDELLNFNITNSPLPSNDIYDIAIDHKTGEVYIATASGLVSYQGDATLGGEKHEEVIVYPNPVRPDYTGPIAVKGLANDAYIKITDIAGGLIWDGKSNGGQAIWDGKNYNGEKAKTGIYLVYSLSNDGKDHYCAKIAFIK